MNAIHIIMDTLKYSCLGTYGSDWVKTPNIDKFADKCVKFTKAYCASFPCMPARRDFMTGNYEFPFRGWGPLEEDDITLPTLLSSAGKTTCLVTDHYHLFRPGSGNYHFDYDCWHYIRGLEGDKLYTDPEESLDIDYRCAPERINGTVRKYYCKHRHFDMKKEEDWPAARTFMKSAEWVKRNMGHEKGFHLQIDCFPPHEPFDPPPGYSEMYDPEYDGDRLITPAYRPASENYTEREIKNIRALYAGNITYVDKWFGIFMDELERMGALDNTMIVLSSDHGTYTGDHGWTGKLGTYMYDCVSHVPMLVYIPGAKPRVESSLVQNVDIVPTILDALDINTNNRFHGKSLMPLIREETEKVRDFTHSGFFGKSHIVNDGRYAFHLHHDNSKDLYWYGLHNSYFVGAGPLGPVEDGGRRKVDVANGWNYCCEPAIFDLENDPEQTTNLFSSRPDLVKIFVDEIRRFLAEIDAPEEYAERILNEHNHCG
jgi:arylsulfatase A-like enzyme